MFSAPKGLYSPNEHAVLTFWLNRRCPEPGFRRLPDPDQALEDLGIVEHPFVLYEREQAAAGAIVLNSLERLDHANELLKSMGRSGYKRNLRKTGPDQRRERALKSQLLFGINWAWGFPGTSWVVTYNTTWLPAYERFVVTASSESHEAFLYTDFALGHYGPDDDGPIEIERIVCDDWETQRDFNGQARWEALEDEGLVSAATISRWANRVWGVE